MTTPILEFVDTVKAYGKGEAEVYALRGLNLAVTAGELVAVMGPSGCGKSTLVHLAGGLEMPSAGRVRVDDRELGDRSAAELATLRRRDVGYVFQRLNLVPSLTAGGTRFPQGDRSRSAPNPLWKWDLAAVSGVRGGRRRTAAGW